MFQYALGRKLALKNNDQLKLDISSYPKQNLRRYRLGGFEIVENIATAGEIKKIKYPFGLFSRIWRIFGFKILRQFYIGWEPSALKKNGTFYLDGFWQSYKYFEDIEKVIKKDFSLKVSLENKVPELLAQITNANSVSLHIRRGDYVSDQKTQKHHGTCDLNYYTRAIDKIVEKISNPTFFIFSDDIEWVKHNLKTNYQVVYVSQPSLEDYEELILMSKCKHNIIANSSFSWWGAWLNSNSEKVVISPTKWMNDNSVKINDLIPPTWTKI